MRGNVIRSLKEAMPLVPVIHIADNPGRNDPGSGELNFANIYKAILDTGFSGHIAMEYKPLGEPVASMAKAVKGLRSSMPA
jgi:hydroxypyruvate isomerase